MNSDTPSRAGDATDELAVLIETLHETERRLEELTAGEVDAVTDRDGRTFLLRHAQYHLRQSEAAKQAAILNGLPAHIAMLDVQGVIVSVNESWRQFSDINACQSPGHCVGMNYLEICDHAHGNDTASAHEAARGIRSVLHGESAVFSIEYACHSPTEQRWFLLTVTSLASNSMSGAVVMHLNTTAQKLAKDMLRESERRFTAMLDKVDLVSVMLDREGRITYCNECLLRLCGWSLAEVIGTDWFDCFMPPETGDMRPVFEKLLVDFPETRVLENELVTRSGGRRLIRWNNSVLRSVSGDVIGTASIGEDITDRKAAEAVLTQRAIELERFHRLSVGRELQMIELKKQVNELQLQAGQEPAYDLTFLDSGRLQPHASHERAS